jgi:hypothetical protein
LIDFRLCLMYYPNHPVQPCHSLSEEDGKISPEMWYLTINVLADSSHPSLVKSMCRTAKDVLSKTVLPILCEAKMKPFDAFSTNDFVPRRAHKGTVS